MYIYYYIFTVSSIDFVVIVYVIQHTFLRSNTALSEARRGDEEFMPDWSHQNPIHRRSVDTDWLTCHYQNPYHASSFRLA